jgi:hypothetical protein
MEIFQILIIIFSVFALTRVYLQKKQKNFSFNEFIFWTLIWGFAILVSFSKPVLEPISSILGFSRGVDVLIYGGIFLLFYMVYRIYAKIDIQQQEITALVKRIAIDNARKKR